MRPFSGTPKKAPYGLVFEPIVDRILPNELLLMLLPGRSKFWGLRTSNAVAPMAKPKRSPTLKFFKTDKSVSKNPGPRNALREFPKSLFPTANSLTVAHGAPPIAAPAWAAASPHEPEMTLPPANVANGVVVRRPPTTVCEAK